jgi:hypothetical protein
LKSASRSSPSPSKGEGRGGGLRATRCLSTPIPTFPLAGGRSKTALSLLIIAFASSIALPARADRLDDDLTSLWESMWDQRGEPQRLTRWNEPLRFRVGGPQGARHRAAIAAAVVKAAQAAELQASEVTLPPAGSNAKDTTNLALLVYDDDDLDDNTPCDAQLQHIDLSLSYVRVRMRTSQVWDCVNHELMHAMGVPGHPSGKTVLSYFPWRQDQLLDLDRLLLTVWYDRALHSGATPFEILWIGGQQVAKQSAIDMPAEQAEQRRRANFAARLHEMEGFALGQGDAPTIVKRSGRASPGHIEDARQWMAYYVGLSYRNAVGVVADSVEAHRWLAKAARAGNTTPAPRELEQLETTMDTALLAKARAQGPR